MAGMSAEDIATAEAEIRERLQKDFVELFNDGYRQHELHAPDVIFMPHLMETVDRRTWSGVCKKRTDAKIFRSDVIDVTVTSPESAFTVSEMELHNAENEKVVVKSLTVWKKTDRGWLLFRDMYNYNHN